MHYARLLASLGIVSTSFLSARQAKADAFAVDSLRAWVRYLADDRLEGRGPGTQGLERAADFIAGRFAAAGLQPAGDHETFFQGFDVTIGVRAAGKNALRIGSHEAVLGQDYVVYGFSESGTTRAPLVFAGYGITAPEYGHDDYAGLDVKERIVLVLRYEPGQTDSTSAFEGIWSTAHADLRRKAILAREHGAVGCLVVTGPLSGEPPETLPNLKPDVGYYSTGIACGQVRPSVLEEAVPGLDLGALQARIDAGDKPAGLGVALPEANWDVGLEKERAHLRNVVGLLPGRDPHRAVLLGAHYDHLGRGGPSSLDPDSHEPHNGADDNASGTAALLALARHFAAGPRPPQSILFAAFSGEELGLAGSAHYVQDPYYPMPFTTAMLNMDMVGRLRDRKLLVFGTRSAEEFTTLLQGLNGEGPKFELRLSGDGYGPSDHMSFYKKDVPVLHFFTGAHSEYHKPSDDADLVNYEGLAEVAAYVGDVARFVMEKPLTFAAAEGGTPPARGDGAGGGFRSSLGTVPDYGQSEDLVGVLLASVRGDSPAEKAGLRGGDLIVQIDATVIRNIQDFVYVLRTRQPGESVAVTVEREGKRLTLDAVLGSGR